MEYFRKESSFCRGKKKGGSEKKVPSPPSGRKEKPRALDRKKGGKKRKPKKGPVLPSAGEKKRGEKKGSEEST